MKLRIPGNAIAIALAALAFATAATGTAAAVASSRVSITDPTTPTQAARVDASGRLNTVGATATVNSVTVSGGVRQIDIVLIEPTTATLAVSRLGLTAPSTNTKDYFVRLEQVRVIPETHTCAAPAQQRTIDAANVERGDNVENGFADPLIVKPVDGAEYCLVARFFPLQSSAEWGDVGAQLSGYIVSGTYTGVGVSTVARPHTSRH